MNSKNGIKIAAIVALVLMGLWVMNALIAFVWQDTLLRGFITDDSLQTGRIVVAGDIARFIFCIPIAISCVMVILQKGKAEPMILTCISAVLTPVAAAAAQAVQSIYTGKALGTDVLVKLGGAVNLSAWASYLLHAVCILAVAVTVVHWYHTKQSGLIQNPHEEEIVK